jgi:hypothetical protein
MKMKALLLAALVATSASAFDAGSIVEQLAAATEACEEGTAEFVEEACAEQDALTAVLIENGYCQVGQAWEAC